MKTWFVGVRKLAIVKNDERGTLGHTYTPTT